MEERDGMREISCFSQVIPLTPYGNQSSEFLIVCI